MSELTLESEIQRLLRRKSEGKIYKFAKFKKTGGSKSEKKNYFMLNIAKDNCKRT